MPEDEISVQEALNVIGDVYDLISDASCLLYFLINENPLLAESQKIKKLQNMIDKAINKLENDMP